MASTHVLEWSNEMSLRLIEEYEGKPELWDNQDKKYRVQAVKFAAWSELAEIFECHPIDVKRKMNSLLASHRRERYRLASGERSHWFAYDALQFIADKFPIKEEIRKLGVEPCMEREDAVEIESNDSPPVNQINHEKQPYNLRKFHKHSRLTHSKPKMKQNRDSYDVFGEHVAQSLRKYDLRTAAIVKHAINNILFETEMKKYTPLNLLGLIDGADHQEVDEVVVEVAEEDIAGIENEHELAHIRPTPKQRPVRLLNESMS